ncbi:MAG: LytTR family transcriptional regulator DNA-binding domain-containing protein [Oscillospiraceae bacterium]
MYATEIEIAAAVKKQQSAIVILDVQSFDNWLGVAEIIESLNRTVSICLISNTVEPAIEAINNLKKVCGYIYKDELANMFESVFTRIYGNLRTVCGEIAVIHYNSMNKIIPFEDIFYIERSEQTQLCTVVHKNGTDEIRANISKLINELPEVFQVVRSSTIANISQVVSFSDCELIFAGGISCLCSKKHFSEIKAFMKQAVMET